jgi:hypothetical protein
MYRIQAGRDYHIYAYGLNIAGIEYETIKALGQILVADDIAIEVVIMKDQLLSDGFFSVRKGLTPRMPVGFDMIDEINDVCIYKVIDPNSDIFEGINAQTYQAANRLFK